MYKIKASPEDFLVEEILELPEGSGEYHYYLLEKKQLSSEQALQEISHILKVPRKSLGIAGNKDKHAITKQYLSIKGRHTPELSRGGWTLTHIGSGPRPISLGMNTGNKFTIIVRECARTPTHLEKFINYFGEQRFGEINITIGRHLIKKEFSKAAKILAAQNYITSDGEDIRRIQTIPKGILKIFLHSYQSYLWNIAAQRLSTQQTLQITELPIIGFGTEFKNEHIEELYDELLKIDGLTQRDFIIRQIPDLSSEGSIRPLYALAKNSNIEKISDGVYQFIFELGRGQYATEYLRQSILGTTEPPAMPTKYSDEQSQ